MPVTEEVLDKVEAAVDAAEEKTDAEIVVAVTPRSGSYADVALRTGIIAAGSLAWGIFCVSLYLGIDLPVLIPATILFFLVHSIVRRSDRALRVLTSRHRREVQVHRELLIAFEEEEVTATGERNGLLIFVSMAERRVLFKADYGIAGRIPPAVWHDLSRQIERSGDDRKLFESLCDHLPRVADLLSDVYPPTEEDEDEIPNRPRIRT